MAIIRRMGEKAFLSQPKEHFVQIAICFLTGQLVACDECDIGDDYCSGNTLMICETAPCAECSRQWGSKECGISKSCVEPESGSAFCALSKMADPQCESRKEYCDGDVIVSCLEGFVIKRYDCRDEQKTCVMLADTTSMCATSATPDPRCQDDLENQYSKCEGKTALVCEYGYLIAELACETACVLSIVGGYYGARCTLSAEPEPRCAEDQSSTSEAIFCIGDVLARCAAGYALEVTDCVEKHATCKQLDSGARCLTAAQEEQYL